MKVKDLLRLDSQVVTIRPEDTLETVATMLASNNIGALPVRNAKGDLVGLISERDIVTAFARKGAKVLKLQVRDMMTRSVITCGPDETVKEIAEAMSRRHFRHMPVVSDGELVGMVSVRDVLGQRLEQSELESNVLRETVIASGGSGG